MNIHLSKQEIQGAHIDMSEILNMVKYTITEKHIKTTDFVQIKGPISIGYVSNYGKLPLIPTKIQ